LAPAIVADQFIQRKGGINEYAARFSRRLGRNAG
jgi:hypothetical protein